MNTKVANTLAEARKRYGSMGSFHIDSAYQSSRDCQQVSDYIRWCRDHAVARIAVYPGNAGASAHAIAARMVQKEGFITYDWEPAVTIESADVQS